MSSSDPKTPNLNILLPPDGKEPWGTDYRSAMNIIDSFAGKEHDIDGSHSGHIVLTLNDLPSPWNTGSTLLGNYLLLTGTTENKPITGDIEISDNKNILPDTNGTCSIGTPSNRFGTVYANNIIANSLPTTVISNIPTNLLGGLKLQKGEVVYIDNSGYANRADAENYSALPAVGLVWNVDPTGTPISIVFAGYHNFGMSVSFTPNKTVFVSNTVLGAISYDLPSKSGYIQVLGYTLSTTEIILAIDYYPKEVKR